MNSSAYTPDLGGIALSIVLGEPIFAITVAGPWFRVGEKLDEIATPMHDCVTFICAPTISRPMLPT